MSLRWNSKTIFRGQPIFMLIRAWMLAYFWFSVEICRYSLCGPVAGKVFIVIAVINFIFLLIVQWWTPAEVKCCPSGIFPMLQWQLNDLHLMTLLLQCIDIAEDFPVPEKKSKSTVPHRRSTRSTAKYITRWKVLLLFLMKHDPEVNGYSCYVPWLSNNFFMKN